MTRNLWAKRQREQHMKYVGGRYKDQIFTAIQFTGNFDEIEAFIGGDVEFRDGCLVCALPQGALRVVDRQWIVRDSSGLYEAYDPAWFAAVFERLL